MLNYFQNASVKMTKEAYLEMCETLGEEPKPEDMPVEYDDFPLEIQRVFEVYHCFQDVWDPMGGNYLGKNLSNVKHIFEILEIAREDYVFTLQIISHIDKIRMDQVAERQKQEEQLRKSKKPA